MKTLAERLSWARNKGGLTQRGLCRLAKLPSERHVGLIESGDLKEPRRQTAKRLATALGVPIDWLSFGQGETPNAADIRDHVKGLLSRPGELQPTAGNHLADSKRAAGA
jgi:transcriptional regulator with XRE-family HTH domain